jgi:hypothetical protein
MMCANQAQAYSTLKKNKTQVAGLNVQNQVVQSQALDVQVVVLLQRLTS